jgi:hypothetical protein
MCPSTEVWGTLGVRLRALEAELQKIHESAKKLVPHSLLGNRGHLHHGMSRCSEGRPLMFYGASAP